MSETIHEPMFTPDNSDTLQALQSFMSGEVISTTELAMIKDVYPDIVSTVEEG